MQADSAQQQGLYRPEFDHDACGIGALADINGERHHQILDDALSILVNLEHRGGTGLEKNTGDGAGILFQVPHHFFRKEAQKCGQILPAEGDYGVAMLFFPQDDKGVEDAMKCYDYLAALGTIDMEHVGIMGWSQGGRLALLTAGRRAKGLV